TFIWAASTVVNRLAVGFIDPAAISFYRWLTAALVISPFLLADVWRARRVVFRHIGKLAMLGLLGMSLYQSLAYFAAHTVSATSMSLILATMPLLTLLLAVPVLHARPTSGMLTGALVSFSGLACLVSGGEPGLLLRQGV